MPLGFIDFEIALIFMVFFIMKVPFGKSRNDKEEGASWRCMASLEYLCRVNVSRVIGSALSSGSC